MPKDKDQVCIISVLFPVPNDGFAIGVKAKIEELLADIPDSHVDLRIGPPTRGAVTPRG